MDTNVRENDSPKDEKLTPAQREVLKFQEQEAISKRDRGIILAVILVAVVMGCLAIIGFLFIKPEPDTVQGQGEATEIRVSGKLPGRIVEFYVEEGQMVHKGDTLVHIHSSLADAKKEQAVAMEQAAAATNRMVDAGAREQTINSAYDLWQQSIAARDIAEKTYQRMENLFAKGVVSEQKRDEAKAAYDAAVAGSNAAKSQYDLAKSGARSEDKQASAAMVKAAQGGVAEVNALLEDQYLLAPCDGEVTVIYPEPSELVAPGAPIMSIQGKDRHAVFNVRETLLKDLKVGSRIKVRIPALDREAIMKVYYIKDMGAYAAWQATKATGNYDARTFEVKAQPEEPIENFLPGMSVLYLGTVK